MSRAVYVHSLGRTSLLAIGMAWLVFSGCGGGSSNPKPPMNPVLQSIAVSPQTTTVAAGLTQQFTASGNYSDGTSKALSSITWATSDTSLATVGTTGLVTAVKQGTVTVTATSAGISGSTPLTVGAPELKSISVSPQNEGVTAEVSQQFTATGTYSDGSSGAVPGVNWMTDDATVATVSVTGLVTTLKEGSVTVIASAGGARGTATLIVGPSLQSLSFSANRTLKVGATHPKGVVVADFNGDGKPDIAVSLFDTNSIAVFLNQGTGTFGTPIMTAVQVSNNIGALAVGDFDEDGKQDLVLSTIAGGGQDNLVLLGKGDGTFIQQSPLPNSCGSITTTVVIDLNTDKHQDLVLGCNGGGAQVYFGKGDGTFSDPISPPVPSFPGSFWGVAVADFNGDGKLDIAGVDSGSPSFSSGSIDFYAGNGDGTFATPTTEALTVTFPFAATAGDFNNDGKQDLLIGYPNDAVIDYGNGDGTFQDPSRLVYSPPAISQNGGISVLSADLLGIHKADAVTTDFNGGTVQIVLNAEIGNLPPGPGIFSFALDPGVSSLAVGDLNGDGILDVVVSNYQTGEITVMLSTQ